MKDEGKEILSMEIGTLESFFQKRKSVEVVESFKIKRAQDFRLGVGDGSLVKSVFINFNCFK